MNVFDFYQRYQDQLATIAETMAANKAAQSVASEAASERKDSLVGKVRDFAKLTHEDSVPVKEARELFQDALKLLKAPEGSVKASGNHFAGYRILLAEGEDISNVSSAAAQDAAASPETRAIKKAKQAFNKVTKKWTAEQWQELLAMYGAGEDDSSDSTSEESEAIVAKARAAA